MYKILGLKSQDFVQNSTNYMGGKSREIVKILGAKLSRYREIITTGRGRSFDQTSFDEGCKLRLSFFGLLKHKTKTQSSSLLYLCSQYLANCLFSCAFSSLHDI